MKVKILLTPLILVISVTLVIWLVVPSFKGVLERRGELSKINQDIISLNEKEKSMAGLMDALSKSIDEQAVVTKFLPDDQNSEDVIKNLNDIATGESLSIFDLSVMQPKKDVALVETEGVLENDPGYKLVEQEKTKTKEFDVSLSVFGGYENIKNIISKIYKLKRFNEITSLEISTRNTGLGDGNPNNLLANFVFKFNYLPKIDLVSNIDEEIFGNSGFDMSIISKIKNFKDHEFNRTNVDSAGKASPFLP